ncbi:helix-hairpin-helix domain-containing protein [Streptomyces flavalbus]|uniref:Helix-hairpin-helix domain-containing protein n=1 Tax=Streptomyces flavalbus TaxID=2665155 RepID=A0ABW2W7F6_9ACTN
MELRSLSGTPAGTRVRRAAAACGPGRGPASDGRVRHRWVPASASATTSVTAAVTPSATTSAAEETRRRAEAMFAQRAGERRESGSGPPEPEPRSGPASARVGLAVRERMPVWLQARCGLRPRSVVALTVLLVAAAVLAVQHFWTGRTQPVRAPEVVRAAEPFESGVPRAVSSAGASGASGASAGEIVVDVSGKVREPGVHRLPPGSRVMDALEAAGGVRPGTATEGLNRARFLVDGEQVVVGGPTPAPGVAGTGGGAASPGAAPVAPVSLNTATAEQLDTLPGVGPVLAQHIIDYRTQHGGFRSVDELREVKGIGDGRYADLRDLVRP